MCGCVVGGVCVFFSFLSFFLFIFKAMRGAHSHWVLLHLISIGQVSATSCIWVSGCSVRLCVLHVCLSWPRLPVSPVWEWLCQAAHVSQRLILPTAQHWRSHCWTASPLFMFFPFSLLLVDLSFLSSLNTHSAMPSTSGHQKKEKTSNLRIKPHTCPCTVDVFLHVFVCQLLSIVCACLWFFCCIRSRPSR